MALDLSKTYATDSEKEENGVWEDFGNGCSLLIARVGNSKYEKTFRDLTKPHRKAIRRNTLSDDVAEKIQVEAIAKTILLGWKGLEEDGKEITYSTEKAIEILTKYKDLRQQIMEVAESIETYRTELIEDSKKK